MADRFDSLSLEELRRLAEARGLTVRPGTRRSHLLKQVREAEAEALASAPRGDAPGSGAGDLQLEISRAKFDLRPDGQPPPWHDIPWGYGETRVTAMPRDPEFLYVYWEATDAAIAEARAKLGNGGPGAFFVLRVYDTTFRHFDGTNANAYFDVPVDRAWNHYFLRVDRPRSTFHVDIGMKSHEGYFAVMARSGAAEMPPAGLSEDGRAEWMTVHAGGRAPGPSTYRHRYVPRPAPPWVGQPHGAHAGTSAAWSWSSAGGGEGWEVDFERVLASLIGGEAAQQGEWYEQIMGGRVVRWIRWTGGRRRFVWQTSPSAVSLPAGLYGPVEIWFEGRRHVVHAGGAGEARYEFGPWYVVIAGAGAHGERRIFDTWVVRVAWTSGGGMERVETPMIYRRILGAFRRRTLVAGASEMLIREEMGASEEWMAGASERLWIGASERMMAGASETLALGASERLWLGASERFWGGASGLGWGGASEFAFVGASERQRGGASETLFGGASRLGGASLYGGASERLLAQGPGGPVVGLAHGEGWSGFAFVPAAVGEASGGTGIAIHELLPYLLPIPVPDQNTEDLAKTALSLPTVPPSVASSPAPAVRTSAPVRAKDRKAGAPRPAPRKAARSAAPATKRKPTARPAAKKARPAARKAKPARNVKLARKTRPARKARRAR